MPSDLPAACVTEPLPEIALETVVVPLRLTTSEALSTTAPEPKVPTEVPFPTCNVPADIVVVPLYVLLPVKVSVPVPC